MKTRIVRIGNSRGIRIPKPVLEQTGLDGVVEIEVKERSLVIYQADGPRRGWDDAFRSMAEHGDDRLPEGAAAPTVWDDTEWEWA